MLFQSYRKYSVQPHSTIACGREHVISRPNIGKRRNIPPGPLSLEISACSMPRARRS